jgi:hypothetical protein
MVLRMVKSRNLQLIDILSYTCIRKPIHATKGLIV